MPPLRKYQKIKFLYLVCIELHLKWSISMKVKAAICKSLYNYIDFNLYLTSIIKLTIFYDLLGHIIYFIMTFSQPH